MPQSPRSGSIMVYEQVVVFHNKIPDILHTDLWARVLHGWLGSAVSLNTHSLSFAESPVLTIRLSTVETLAEHHDCGDVGTTPVDRGGMALVQPPISRTNCPLVQPPLTKTITLTVMGGWTSRWLTSYVGLIGDAETK